jgi:hypothetical protein
MHAVPEAVVNDETSKLNELGMYAGHWFDQRRNRLQSDEERLEIAFVDGVIAGALAMGSSLLRDLESEVAKVNPQSQDPFIHKLRRRLFPKDAT